MTTFWPLQRLNSFFLFLYAIQIFFYVGERYIRFYCILFFVAQCFFYGMCNRMNYVRRCALYLILKVSSWVVETLSIWEINCFSTFLGITLNIMLLIVFKLPFSLSSVSKFWFIRNLKRFIHNLNVFDYFYTLNNHVCLSSYWVKRAMVSFLWVCSATYISMYDKDVKTWED